MKAIINGKLVFPEKIEEGTLLIDGDKIVAAGKINVPEGAEIIDAKGLYVGPGFIDQHAHGYMCNGEIIPVNDDPAGAAAGHLKHGTTSFIASSDYGDSEETHMNFIKKAVEAIEGGEETSLEGIHLEGPFINAGYGSNSDTVLSYSDELCEKLLTEGKGHVIHMTYAPELPTAPKLEEKLNKYGVVHSVGHSCAGPDDIERAVENGATVATHLYDAMGNYMGVEASAKRTQHPQDCTADLVLTFPGMYYELIVDENALHATKYSVRRTLRTAGEDHVILISDTFCEPYPQKDENADVNYDKTGTLSGSRLTVARAAKNFKKFTGADIRVLFKVASTNSAKAMGLFDKVGSIEKGKLANIVLVDDEFDVKKIFFRGKEVK